MWKFPAIAFTLLIHPSPASALPAPEEALSAPTAAELQDFIQQSWRDVARRVRDQARLTEIPSHLTSLPRTLCRTELPRTYECVSLVEYQLPSGIRRSSFVRHYVAQDSRRGLADAIIVRETPRPR